jgi:hypothetical protein
MYLRLSDICSTKLTRGLKSVACMQLRTAAYYRRYQFDSNRLIGQFLDAITNRSLVDLGARPAPSSLHYQGTPYPAKHSLGNPSSSLPLPLFSFFSSSTQHSSKYQQHCNRRPQHYRAKTTPEINMAGKVSMQSPSLGPTALSDFCSIGQVRSARLRQHPLQVRASRL